MVYSVGDYVFVPHAFDMVWEPTLTRVERVKWGRGPHYYCKVPSKNYSVFNAKIEYVEYGYNYSEVFDNYNKCKNYIKNHYYDGYCHKCPYEEIAGTVLNCRNCDNYIEEDDDHICKYSGIKVGSRYNSGPEICCKFIPRYFPKEWTCWRYYDLLKNCEFNQNCAHHKYSVHKTCSFDKYMNQLMKIPLYGEINGKPFEYGIIKRSEWVDQSFIDDDGYYLWGVAYEPEYNKRGIKKGTANDIETFDKKVKIQGRTHK